MNFLNNENHCWRFMQVAFVMGLAFSVTSVQAQRDLAPSVKYLMENASSLEVSESDLAEMQVSHVTKGSSSFEIAYLQQTKNGISIHNRIVNVIYGKDGTIIGHSGTLSDKLNQRGLVTAPGLSPVSALARAAAELGLGSPGSVSILEPGIGAEQKGILSKGSISQDDITFRLVYQDTGNDGLKLAWEFVIYEHSSLHWWQIRMDATTGAYLGKNDWVSNCKVDPSLTKGRTGHFHGPTCGDSPSYLPLLPSAYNVFAMPVESPNHGARSQAMSPWLNGTGSPFGWHDDDGAAGDEYTITRGNNVYASEDQDADNVPGVSPDGGVTLDFDFPINFANAPSTYADAAITNLFYWNNIIHDVLYEYGFDEMSGNFQENNYGNGALGSDYVNADALDGSGTNNANFGTPPDGSNPRMQMYVWNITTPDVTSDLDNGIIAHEYGHGVSNRLTGGPNTTSCLGNSEQMGEGWSDYIGIILTIEAGDTRTDNRGVGTYVLDQATTGNGIRQYPYNTNLAINSHTYGDVPGMAVPHGVGSVWCMMIWEMTWDLIDLYGFDTDIYNGTGGNNIAFQLVMDGMKLQPCQPGFVDGRDAILLADQINNGGANQCLIWAAFAKRGLGASADQGSSGSSTDGTEAFDTPCFCDAAPGVIGCTDPVACNYDVLAVCDDFSCTYPGCTNPAACNYDPEAGCDDGLCLLIAATPTLTLTTDCWGGEVSWEIIDGLGNQVATNPVNYGNQTTYVYDACLVPGQCYTFIIYDSFGDGLSGIASGCSTDGTYEMIDDDGTLLFDIGPNPNYGSSASHPFCPGLGSLMIDKTAATSVLAGSNLTYTITVENTTGGDVTNVSITDQIPAEVSYIPGSASCTAAFADPTLTLDLGTIAAGATVVCTYDVAVPASPFTALLYEDDVESGAGSFVPSTAIGAYLWSQVTTDANSPVTSWYAEDPGDQSDQYLDLVGIGPLTATSELIFSHRYDTEAAWDGGVIEISIDAGVNWTDIGALITQNGYNGTITVNPASTISGQPAFTGNSGSWLETVADLSSYAGQTVSIRWRMASDGFVSGNGWWVDDVIVSDDLVSFTNNACVTSTEFPTPICSMVTTLVTDPGCPLITWYADSDGDSFGDLLTTVDACTQPVGFVADNTDCDDNDNTEFPGQTWYLGVDGDSDGSFGSQLIVSQCENPGGYSTSAPVIDDCDDGDGTIFPGNPEVCDGKDNDCNGSIDDGLVFTDYFPDMDNDGFGDAGAAAPVSTCDGPPVGMVADNTDCDDGNGDVYPGAPSTEEGIDNDCNGIVDPDEALPCVGDFDGNGTIDVQDLLIFLADFGCVGTCIADLNNDGATNAADLLLWLPGYGTICP